MLGDYSAGNEEDEIFSQQKKRYSTDRLNWMIIWLWLIFSEFS